MMMMTLMMMILMLMVVVPPVSAQTRHSICSTSAYRQLSEKMQHEHQCRLIEQVQSELFVDKEDRIRRYKDKLTLLSQLDYKLDQIMYALDEQYDAWGEEWLDRVKGHLTDEKKRRLGAVVIKECDKELQGFAPNMDSDPVYQDCDEVFNRWGNVSGVYPILMPNNHTVLVYCDQDTTEGGWTVIHRRLDGSVDFNRDWDHYKFGFGNPNAEYWLGNEYLHLMTHNKNYTLRVDLWDWEGGHAHALYTNFSVSTETDHYRLRVQDYHGDAGDAMDYHTNSAFSTPDRDNDVWFGSCATRDQAGWWYRDCSFASLNSQYYAAAKASSANEVRKFDGILWYHWKKDYSYSMRRAEMKIRPIYYN